MELDRIKALPDDKLQDLSGEARRMIETGDLARRTHGEIMLSVIGAVSSNRRAHASGSVFTAALKR
jgi:hypothetical protein